GALMEVVGVEVTMEDSKSKVAMVEEVNSLLEKEKGKMVYMIDDEEVENLMEPILLADPLIII
ncbi:hypothetical protein KI387_031654, partial [Taxus chinensis]